MKLKLLVPFLLIAILPVVMLTWFGRRVVAAEKAELTRNLEHVYLGKLRDHDATIRKVVEARRRHLLKIADALHSDVDAAELRRLTRKDSVVRQLFMLDDRSRIIFPSINGPSSVSEREFLQRTAKLWEGKYVPGKNGSSVGQSLLRTSVVDKGRQAVDVTQYRQVVNSPPMQQVKTALPVSNTEITSDGGWLSWYWENGIHLMYWVRLEDGRVVGAEFDRARLIADVIAELPNTDPMDDNAQDERVALRDASAKVVYQWGLYDPPKDAKAVVNLPLTAPLAAWTLAYYPGPLAIAPDFGRSSAFTMTATLVAVGLIFLTLAVFFYREHTRAMREAATRVSFVNRVSHELKTPLTNIRMYAELLAVQMEGTDDKAMDRLNVITGEAERLSRLIGNVLTFSRSERDKLTIHKSSAEIDSVVNQVLERFDPSFAAAGITSSRMLDATETVRFDTDALEQILTNLLSNVEKYAAAGGRVEIRTETTGRVATISVADDGPGIPPKQAEMIFKPFTRLDDSLNEGISGTGIGLGIARELARRHGGDLDLEPTAKGARFVVTLNVGDE